MLHICFTVYCTVFWRRKLLLIQPFSECTRLLYFYTQPHSLKDGAENALDAFGMMIVVNVKAASKYLCHVQFVLEIITLHFGNAGVKRSLEVMENHPGLAGKNEALA